MKRNYGTNLCSCPKSFAQAQGLRPPWPKNPCCTNKNFEAKVNYPSKKLTPPVKKPVRAESHVDVDSSFDTRFPRALEMSLTRLCRALKVPKVHDMGFKISEVQRKLHLGFKVPEYLKHDLLSFVRNKKADLSIFVGLYASSLFIQGDQNQVSRLKFSGGAAIYTKNILNDFYLCLHLSRRVLKGDSKCVKYFGFKEVDGIFVKQGLLDNINDILNEIRSCVQFNNVDLSDLVRRVDGNQFAVFVESADESIYDNRCDETENVSVISGEKTEAELLGDAVLPTC